MSDDLDARLLKAVGAAGPGSSDFDLNAGLRREGVPLRGAAVLVAITGDSRVVLTKRSSRLAHHPGQIAFAGGKIDAGDAGPEAAALREAREEIGLDPGIVRVLGCMPPHVTVTDFTVTPVIARIGSGFRPVAEPGEVDEVFEVPLAHVLQRENYVIEGRIWQGQLRRYYAVPWGPYYIWGATARMLRALAEVMA